VTEVSSAETRALVTEALMAADDDAPVGVSDAAGGGAGRPELREGVSDVAFA
jgi:hypothetical protein